MCNDSEKLKPRLNVYEDDESIIFEYHSSNTIEYDKHHSQVFEPYYFSSFSADSKGVELNRVYNLVTEVLKGGLECKKDQLGCLYFEIELPKNFDL